MFDAAFAARFIPAMLSAAQVVVRVQRSRNPALIEQLTPEMFSAAQDVFGVEGLRRAAFPGSAA